MDSAKSRSAGSTATVTPLLQRPKTAKSISAKAFDGFRPAPERMFAPAHGADGRHYDTKAAMYNIANTQLVRRLKGRHLQMIAIGGSIGNTSPSGLTLESWLTRYRDWTFYRLWSCTCNRRAGFSFDSFHFNRSSPLLHCSSSWGDGGDFPRRWIFFHVCHEIY